MPLSQPTSFAFFFRVSSPSHRAGGASESLHGSWLLAGAKPQQKAILITLME